MPTHESYVTCVYLSPDVDDHPTLSAFRECAARAHSIDEFRALIKGTIAKNEPYKVLVGKSIQEIAKPDLRGRIFELRKPTL